MRDRKWALYCLSIACLIGMLTVGCSNGGGSKNSADRPALSRDSEEQSADTQNRKSGLKSFSAETLDGDAFTPENLSDKDLTMINFWGTFCSPCIEEMPDLAEFAKTLPENVQVITICVDGEYAPEDARMLLEQAGFEGITLISGDGDFAEMLGNVLAVPTTIFLDSEGNLVGDVVEGGGLEDFSGFYLDKINKALRESGKGEISLEK